MTTIEYQLMNDWTDSSDITIDGITFGVISIDGSQGFSEDDLKNGGQERIHKAIRKIAELVSKGSK